MSAVKLLLTAVETAAVLGIGRNRTYELIASGELPSLKIGHSVRVPVAALSKWVDERATDGGKTGE